MCFSVLSSFFLFMMEISSSVCVFILFCLTPMVWLTYSGEVSYVSCMESSIALPLCSLTLWVGGLSLLVSPGSKLFSLQFKGGVSLLVSLLLCSFLVMDGFLFYVLFEACLGPTSFLVACWGHTPEREEATLYMIFYTIVGGSLHMVGLIGMDYMFGTTSFLSGVSMCSGGSSGSLWVWWLCLIVPFMIKAPCYGFHFWLPKAHVEAPVSGSMMLAAVMLKLGIFGLFRYSAMIVVPLMWVVPLQVLGCVGGVISCVVALRQSDIKSIVAYASVSHMSFCIAGIFIFSDGALSGVYLMMVSHGFTSSGLFAWAGVMYDKFGSRSLMNLSGMRSLSGVQYSALILLLMANSSMPPFFAFYGEYFIFSSIFHYCPMLGAVLGASMILGLSYSLVMVVCTQHCGVSPQLSKAGSLSEREWMVLGLHLVPLFMYFLCPDMLLM